jgi:hypothetical protein
MGNPTGEAHRRHGRYVTFQMAEVAMSRQMFSDITVVHRAVAGAARAGMSDRQEQNAAGGHRRGARWRGQKRRLFSVSVPSTASFDGLLPV